MSEIPGNSNELDIEKLQLYLHPRVIEKCMMLGLLDGTSMADQIRAAYDAYADVVMSGATVLTLDKEVEATAPARGVGQHVALQLDAERRQVLDEIIEALGGDESEHTQKAVDYYIRLRASAPDFAEQIELARERERLRRAEQSTQLSQSISRHNKK